MLEFEDLITPAGPPRLEVTGEQLQAPTALRQVGSEQVCKRLISSSESQRLYGYWKHPIYIKYSMFSCRSHRLRALETPLLHQILNVQLYMYHSRSTVKTQCYVVSHTD